MFNPISTSAYLLMHTVSNRKIVYNNRLRIETAEITDAKGHTFSHERINREDAAVVLVFNTDTNLFIFTEQFRYAIYDKEPEPILEAVAGKVEDEEPLHTAIRETEEEIGYRVKPENIRLLAKCYASPGYSAECYYVYSATVTKADKVSDGGGLEEEHEEISIVELSPEEFYRMIDEGEIKDAKTYVAGLLHTRRISI